MILQIIAALKWWLLPMVYLSSRVVYFLLKEAFALRQQRKASSKIKEFLEAKKYDQLKELLNGSDLSCSQNLLFLLRTVTERKERIKLLEQVEQQLKKEINEPISAASHSVVLTVQYGIWLTLYGIVRVMTMPGAPNQSRIVGLVIAFGSSLISQGISLIVNPILHKQEKRAEEIVEEWSEILKMIKQYLDEFFVEAEHISGSVAVPEISSSILLPSYCCQIYAVQFSDIPNNGKLLKMKQIDLNKFQPSGQLPFCRH